MRTTNFSGESEIAALAEEAATVQTITKSGKVEHGVLAHDLMLEVMGVVPVLGGRKVTVGFAGDGAFCNADFSYVNVPALPASKVVPIQIAREIRGFAAHEAAHLAFTDTDIFPAKIIDQNGNFDPLLKEVWNCIEDFFIERNWLELYPGARKNFAATEIRCCHSYMAMYSKNADIAKDLRSVGPVALTWLRAIHFGLGTQISRDCFQTLPPELRTRVLGWFQDIQDVETTEDCLEAAKIIRADIDANPFDPNHMPQNQQQQGQSGQGNGQGGQGQGQGQGNGQGQGQGQGNGQGQGQGQGNGQGQGQGQGQGSGQQQGAGQGQANGPGASSGTPSQVPGAGQHGPAPTPISTSHDLSGVLSDAKLIDANATITAEVLSTAQSGPIAEILVSDEGVQKSAEATKAISGIIATTSAQLRKSLKATSRDRWRGGRMEGRIDPVRLAGAVTGSTELYKRKHKGEAIDTAVSIVIDCSGSMSGFEIAVCQQMGLALESALAPTPVKHEIIGFTTGDLDQADPMYQTMAAANAQAGKDIHIRPISVYEFRSFGASHAQAIRTLGNMTDVPMGGTPTDQAILLAHDRLARRPEKRHVMFVLTDGEPDDGRACKKAVAAVEACGVTVIGIGIGSDAVKSSFKDFTMITGAQDLPAVMMAKLNGILLGAKTTVAVKGEAAQERRRGAA